MRAPLGYILLAAVGLLLTGCDGLFPNDSGDGPQLPVAGDAGAGRTNVVTVTFANLTDATAVDVQFHVADGPIAVFPDDLFVPANGVTRSIGLAGSGIIPPHGKDTIQLPCTADLTMGTLGGIFAEAESGEVFGTGQARWVSEDPLGFCGVEVTFEFSGSDDAFLTRIRIGK